jgi:hypothetical protein
MVRPGENGARKRYWAGAMLAAALAGAVAGPVVLTRIAFWDHVRRYGTGAEFWIFAVTVPLGILSGITLATLLAEGTAHVVHGEGRQWLRPAEGFSPLRGRWLWYLLAVVLFVVLHFGVYGMMLAALLAMGWTA